MSVAEKMIAKGPTRQAYKLVWRSNYRAIKFMIHNIKIWESTAEASLRGKVMISEQQCGCCIRKERQRGV